MRLLVESCVSSGPTGARLLAGMLVDKSLASPALSPASASPRRRHHAQSTLVYWTSRAIDLLAPITVAERAWLSSRVLAMDETSIKAGRGRRFDAQRVAVAGVRRCRRGGVPLRAVARALSRAYLSRRGGTLLSDGYEAYAAYAAQRPGEVTHALCWSHTRRGAGEGLRARGGGRGAGDDWCDVRARGADPLPSAHRRGQARLPSDTPGRSSRPSGGPSAIDPSCAEEPAGQGVELRAGTPFRTGGIPRRPRCGHRYESTSSGRYVRFPSGRGIGCSLRARLVRSGSASSRPCW